jgi:hypothetical protein
MTGAFLYLNADDELPKHAHAVFYLDNDRRLVFRDQRKFGVMKLVPASQLAALRGIAELAPEPFTSDFNSDYLKDVLKRSQRSLKTLLLDQTKVLGLGNIYAAEALFRSRINPFKPAAKLSKQRVVLLHEAIKEVLEFAWPTSEADSTSKQEFHTARLLRGSGKSTNAKASLASSAALGLSERRMVGGRLIGVRSVSGGRDRETARPVGPRRKLRRVCSLIHTRLQPGVKALTLVCETVSTVFLVSPFQPVTLNKELVFVFKRPLAMMRPLIRYVLEHPIRIRMRHRECAVATPPREPTSY